MTKPSSPLRHLLTGTLGFLVAMLLWFELVHNPTSESAAPSPAPAPTATPAPQPPPTALAPPQRPEPASASAPSAPEPVDHGDLLHDPDDLTRFAEHIADTFGGRVFSTECNGELPCSVIIVEHDYTEQLDALDTELRAAAPEGYQPCPILSVSRREGVYSMSFMYIPDDYAFADLPAETLLDTDPMLAQLDSMSEAYGAEVWPQILADMIESGEAYERLAEQEAQGWYVE